MREFFSPYHDLYDEDRASRVPSSTKELIKRLRSEMRSHLSWKRPKKQQTLDAGEDEGERHAPKQIAKNKLTLTLCHVPGHDFPLKVFIPPIRGSGYSSYYGGRRQWEGYYNDHHRLCPMLCEGVPYEERPAVFEAFRNDCLQSSSRKGHVLVQDRSIEVLLGIRRAEKFNEIDAGTGLHLGLLASRQWRAFTPTLDFYPLSIVPYLRRDDRAGTSPVTWVSNRLSLALGYAFELVGRDFPAASVEEPFLKVAPIAGNLAPKTHKEPRRFEVNERLAKFLSLFGSPETIVPELIAVVAQNIDRITQEDLTSKNFQKFVSRLPYYLEAGLNIDRITEALAVTQEHGYPTTRALPHILTIVENTFGRVNKPWWFKEDFSIFGKKKLKDITLAEAARISALSGCAYEYTREVFRDRCADPKKYPMGRKTSLRVCAFVTNRYGIHNPERAKRVAQYFDAILKEHPHQSPKEAFKIFSKLAHYQRPCSVARALFEGEGATLNIPGLFASLNTHLDDNNPQHRDLSIPALSAAPEHFPLLTHELEKPLLERAKLLPGTDAPRGIVVPLLLSYHGPERLLLPGDIRNGDTTSKIEKPVTGFIGFQERLVAEVIEREREHVASVYFAFCAPKFPNPLDPPPGFLELLYKFTKLPNPEIVHTALVAPEERHETAESNKEKVTQKYMIVSHLLDTWLLGITQWEDVEKALQWVTAPLSVAETRKIQTDQDWWGEKCRIEYLERVSDELYGTVQKLRKTIARYERDFAFEKFCGIEPNQWHLRHHEENKTKLARALKGLETHERHYSTTDEEYREYSTHFLKTLRNPFPNHKREPRRYHYDSTLSDATRTKHLERMRTLVGILESAAERKILFERGIITAAHTTRPVREELLAAIEKDKRIESENAPAIIPTEHGKKEFGAKLDTLMQYGLLDFNAVNAAYENPQGESHRKTFAELREAAQKLEVLLNFSEQERHNPWDYCGYKKPERTVEGFFQALENLRSDRFINFAGSTLSQKIFWRLRYSGVRETIADMTATVLPQALVVGASNNLLNEDMPESAVAGATKSVLTTAFALQALHSFDKNTDWNTYRPDDIPTERSSSAVTVSNNLPKVISFSGWKEQTIAEFKERVPKILNTIYAARRERFLLGPIGGKIHVIHEIDHARLEQLKSDLGLQSTGFALIHAGHSLLLPPMPTPEELNYLITFLGNEGVLDAKLPEIQFACSGRLSNKLCGVLGSTMLLGTDLGIRYDPKSFDTNRTTGQRLVVYDANGPRSNYPFATSLPGRTDILGRQDSADAAMYQLVHSVLAHAMTDGILSGLGREYAVRHARTLKRFGLGGILKESWVIDNVSGKDTEDGPKRHFEKAITPCVDAWFAANDLAKKSGQQEGIIREVHNNLDWLRGAVKIIQTEALASEAYAAERKVLLGEG